MKLPIFQVDAFTGEAFSGNPAAVCPLESWLPEEVMQAIAVENNLSETAFLVQKGRDEYGLRWFSPQSEVQLCGHGTLASALVIFNVLQKESTRVRFHTCSGTLRAEKEGDYFRMDFPAVPAKPCTDVPKELTAGLRPFPLSVLESGATSAERNYFVLYEAEDDVRNAEPDLATLAKLHPAGVCITAPGAQCDFVSRYFVPSYGIPEDPVTGSTHCTLGLYWADRLKKRILLARQVSAREGELIVEPHASRVTIKGKAVLYLQGTIAF